MRALLAVLTLVGGMAVAYSPPSLSDTAAPVSPSAIYPGDGAVARNAPWHIDALDFFFEGVPPSNHPGVIPVTFHNRSDHEGHEISVYKLADPRATVQDAVDAANNFGEFGLISGGFATKHLGEVGTSANTQQDGRAFDFTEPGAYVYYCFVETHGGHWNYGMVGKILISLPAQPAS